MKTSSETVILYLGASVNFYPYCPRFLANFVNIWYKKFAHNAVECARLPALFSSYLLACYALSPFAYATDVFFLPAFHFGRDSVFDRRSVRLFFEFLLSAWGSETCFTFSDCGPESCWCCSDFDVFCDWLIKFWQRHATVLLSLL